MKVSVKPSFVLYLLAICLLTSLEACAGMISALAVHELAHFLAIRYLKEPVCSVEIAPFGGVMTYHPGRSASKGARGVVLAAAGPLGNYAMILLLNALPKTWGAAWIRQAMISNLAMMLFNLLPALPLDGGAVIFSIGFYLFNVSALIRALCAMGVLTGGMLCALGLYGWICWKSLNISLIVVGVYLIYAAYQSRARMLSQHLYVIMQEKLSRQSEIEGLCLLRAAPDTRLWELAKYIGHAKSAAFLIEDERGNVWYMNETEVFRALLDQPMDLVGEALKNKTKKKCIIP